MIPFMAGASMAGGAGAAGVGGAASALGPIGALAGAGISGFGAMSDRKKQKEAEKKAREEQMSIPGHEKLSKVYDSIVAMQEKKLQSIATLAQAAMDWSNMMR